MTTQQSTLTSRQQREVTRKAKAAAKAEGQTPKLCECNCGGYTVRQDASFISGHDQRHKGNLLRKFDGGDEAAAVELMRRGWKSNDDLEARAEKVRVNAEAKAQLQAEREKARLNAEARPLRRRQRPSQSSRHPNRSLRSPPRADDVPHSQPSRSPPQPRVRTEQTRGSGRSAGPHGLWRTR